MTTLKCTLPAQSGRRSQRPHAIRTLLAMLLGALLVGALPGPGARAAVAGVWNEAGTLQAVGSPGTELEFAL